MVEALTGKIEADKINRNFSELDSKIESVNSGPGGHFNSVAELNAAWPNGSDRFFVVQGFSYWWKNNKWEKGDAFIPPEIGDDDVDKSNVTNTLLDKRFAFSGAVDFNFSAKEIVIPGGYVYSVRSWPSFTSQTVVMADGYNYLVFDVLTNKFLSTNTYYSITDNIMLVAVYRTNTKQVFGMESYTIDGKLPDIARQNVQGNLGMVFCYGDKINFNFATWKIELPKELVIFYPGGYRTFSKAAVTEIDMVNNSEGVLILDVAAQTFRVSPPNYLYNPDIREVPIAIYSRQNGGMVQMIGENYLIKGYEANDIERVPQYAKDAISLLNEYLIKNRKDTNLNVIHICDPHHYENSSENGLSHIYASVRLARMGQADLLVGNGDLVHDYLRAATEKAMEEVRAAFQSANYLTALTRGNHDVNKTTDLPQITSTEFANRVIYPQSKRDLESKSNDGYYFVNFDDKKIRAVFLNATNDTTVYPGGTATWFGFDDPQLKWLAEKALSVDDDWQVVVFGHTHLTKAIYPTEVEPKGGPLVVEILNAFTKGVPYINAAININVSFVAANRLIGYYHGHTHCDYMKKPAGYEFYNVSTASSKPDYIASPPVDNKSWPRPMKTVQEDCWDVLMIDSTIRKVKLKRYGAGQDREYDY